MYLVQQIKHNKTNTHASIFGTLFDSTFIQYEDKVNNIKYSSGETLGFNGKNAGSRQSNAFTILSHLLLSAPSLTVHTDFHFPHMTEHDCPHPLSFMSHSQSSQGEPDSTLSSKSKLFFRYLSR